MLYILYAHLVGVVSLGLGLLPLLGGWEVEGEVGQVPLQGVADGGIANDELHRILAGHALELGGALGHGLHTEKYREMLLNKRPQ